MNKKFILISCILVAVIIGILITLRITKPSEQKSAVITEQTSADREIRSAEEVETQSVEEVETVAEDDTYQDSDYVDEYVEEIKEDEVFEIH